VGGKEWIPQRADKYQEKKKGLGTKKRGGGEARTEPRENFGEVEKDHKTKKEKFCVGERDDLQFFTTGGEGGAEMGRTGMFKVVEGRPRVFLGAGQGPL